MGDIREPKLIIFTSGYERLSETAKELAERFPGVPSIGTSGQALFGTGHSDTGFCAAVLLEGVTALAGVITDLATAPIYDEPELRDKVKSVHPGIDDTVCIEFCTNAEEKLVSTINIGLGEHVPLVGGSAFDPRDKSGVKVAVNGKTYKDACVYAVIKNNSGKIRTYRENIYSLIPGQHLHVATKVNRSTKELLELDGRPAADVYSEALNIPVKDIPGNVFKNPVGRIVGEDVYIASMYAVGKNDSLVFYKQVNQNDMIGILELDDYRKIRQQTNERIRKENPHIGFVFTVNCIFRYGLFDNEGYVPQFLSDLNSFGPYFGYTGGGEQYKDQHVNQTMVAAVFE